MNAWTTTGGCILLDALDTGIQISQCAYFCQMSWDPEYATCASAATSLKSAARSSKAFEAAFPVSVKLQHSLISIRKHADLWLALRVYWRIAILACMRVERA